MTRPGIESMTRPGIEPMSPGPFQNTLPTNAGEADMCVGVCVCVCASVCVFVYVCVCVY